MIHIWINALKLVAAAVALGILLGLLVIVTLSSAGCAHGGKRFACPLSPIPVGDDLSDKWICVEEPHCYCPNK